jgi:hypothetical protein
MPDRDVFDRTVRGGWQSASRGMLTSEHDPLALGSVIRALAADVKRLGCPGFDTAVGIVVDALSSIDPDQEREAAHRRLDHLRRQDGNGRTEILVDLCKCLLVMPEVRLPTADNALCDTVAVRLLAGFADACMCPARLLTEVIEHEHISFQTVRARRKRMMALLVEAPETARLAGQLLVDPSGGAVRTPRMPRVKTSQADILVSALTD